MCSRFSLLQVINVHYAFEKFLPLIPYFASNEDVLLTEIDWEREFVDVPLASKPRVLTGITLLCPHCFLLENLQGEVILESVLCKVTLFLLFNFHFQPSRISSTRTQRFLASCLADVYVGISPQH